MRYKQIVFAFVVLCLCFTAFTAESVAFSAPAKVTKVTVSAVHRSLLTIENYATI